MITDRHGLNPIICGPIDYTADETEFIHAIGEWQLRTGRKFPAWSEVLMVLRDIGYRKQPALMSDYLVSRRRPRHSRLHGR